MAKLLIAFKLSKKVEKNISADWLSLLLPVGKKSRSWQKMRNKLM